MAKKKVMLFIVEGPTDETSLSYGFEPYLFLLNGKISGHSR